MKPQNPITIRPAVPADAHTIHDIQMRAFAEEGRLSETTQIPPLMEDFAALEEDIRTQTVFTARDGERIIGSARGVLDGSQCMIHRVSVEPSYQGRGIGVALVCAVEDAHPNVERFTLTTNTLVPGNVPFYERRGYHVTELTKHGDKIVLAQMAKVRARGDDSAKA
ncbi:MAG TPA: GNAT family N-acetyltransferase [Casimicrobium sp.]|nr:GNAT family N-acetyltransferase [Casimicrobium sp.]